MILANSGKRDTVKKLIFQMLSREYPLTTIQLVNHMRKRYGKNVTFQAVRKELLNYLSDSVLIKEDRGFSINKGWVLETKKELDNLYENLSKESGTPQNSESIEGEISVFTFSSLNEMMKFWQDLIEDWLKKIKQTNYKTNCYQAAHVWEGLLHLDKENVLMDKLKKKEISSYILMTGNTPLDKNIKKFYQAIGVEVYISPSRSSFDRGYYVGTYGDLIIQSQYPEEIVKSLDKFFKENKTIEKLNLKDLSDIVNKKIKVKLTVIKNLEMAKQLNKSILTQMD